MDGISNSWFIELYLIFTLLLAIGVSSWTLNPISELDRVSSLKVFVARDTRTIHGATWVKVPKAEWVPPALVTETFVWWRWVILFDLCLSFYFLRNAYLYQLYTPRGSIHPIDCRPNIHCAAHLGKVFICAMVGSVVISTSLHLFWWPTGHW